MSRFEFAGFSLSFAEGSSISVPALIIFLAGGLIIAAMLLYHLFLRRKQTSAIRYSDISIVSRVARTGRQRFRPLLVGLRLLGIALLVVAFARPRSGTELRDVTSEGVDIMLCLDVSSSMQAEDFKPNNRLYVAKEEIKKFIQRRTNDRIGLVVFARSAFTQCPLTVDYGVLISFVDQVTFGVVEDGTAIGMGLANAINRLRESEAKSKVIVLLTDGDNNAGEIDPQTAAQLATAFDIKIYTIAAGKPGNAMFPVQDPIFGKRYVYQPTEIDEETLQQIATITGGKYFRARSGEELDEIYTQIDALERTEIKVSSHVQYKELFQSFTIAGLLLLVLEAVLGQTWLRKLP